MNDFLMVISSATMVVVTRVGDLDFDGYKYPVTIQLIQDRFDAIVYHEVR